MVLQHVKAIFILRRDVVIGEGFSRLGVFKARRPFRRSSPFPI
jgi:hypothetical protein